MSQRQVIKQRVINLVNGPECNRRRSQFILRMTEFADVTGLCVRAVYYPHYHSKYNAIDRRVNLFSSALPQEGSEEGEAAQKAKFKT